eukprot:jgi/Botrbrau1/12499/Bobra.0169s0046.1
MLPHSKAILPPELHVDRWAGPPHSSPCKVSGGRPVRLISPQKLRRGAGVVRRCTYASVVNEESIQKAVDELVAHQVTSKPLALKEWAPICAALGEGDQMFVIRKGGIKEPAFKPAAAKFLLFPTGFHTDEDLLQERARNRYAREIAFDPKAQPTLELQYGAEVMYTFMTMDPAVLEVSVPYHIMGPDFLDARFKWRPRQPLTVMELRVWRLANPIVLAPTEDFWGCFSWLDLSQHMQGMSWLQGTPVIPDGEFRKRQEGLRKSFSSLKSLNPFL